MTPRRQADGGVRSIDVGAKLLLTTGEAAAVLGVSRSKLYQLLATGALESVRIDRSRRVPAVALWEYVELLRPRGVDDQSRHAAEG